MAWIGPVLLSVTQVLGGLALFIFGMKGMSGGLREAAGSGLRAMLQGSTRTRAGGLVLGTTLGFFLHSSGATVMLVGFLNAGLMNLVQAVPVIFGANIGTTLSMQAVSLRLSDFSYVAIALGFLASMGRAPRRAALGRTLFGFGLLFLGMEIMSQGVFPWRETLQPVLERIDGTGLGGMLAGVTLALVVTAVVQSSGATIGMAFALVQAGVFTSVSQTLPIVLGSHIGTCVTALLASLGGQAPARRAAGAHLVFNAFNVVLAIALRAPLVTFLESLGGSVTRQTANAHTVVMVVATVFLLPVTGSFTRLVERLVPRKGPEPEPSHLQPEVMESIATAIPAIRREFARLMNLSRESLELNRQLLETPSVKAARRIRTIEDVIDSIKVTMTRDLRDLARHGAREHLSDLDQWGRCIVEAERIGDHLNTLRKLSEQRRSEPGHILFGRELTHRLNAMFAQTRDLLKKMEAHFLATPENFHEQVDDILQGRVELLEATMKARALLVKRLTEARLQPRAMYYLSSYFEVFERIARHAQILASTSPEPAGTE